MHLTPPPVGATAGLPHDSAISRLVATPGRLRSRRRVESAELIPGKGVRGPRGTSGEGLKGGNVWWEPWWSDRPSGQGGSEKRERKGGR